MLGYPVFHALGAMLKRAAADLSSLGDTRSTFPELRTMKGLLDEAQLQG